MNHYRKIIAAFFVVTVIGIFSTPAFGSDINTSKYYDYPLQALYLKAIEVTDNQIRIIPASVDEGPVKFSFAVNGEENPGGIINLPRPIEPKPYPFKIDIKVTGANRTEKLEITYYPRELYAQSGRTEPGYIIVDKSTIPVHKPEYIYKRPDYNKEDIEYARKQWGHLQRPGRTDLELAHDIGESIIKSLESHRGIPSDVMNSLTPRQQYERVMQGKDRVCCGNIALIYQYACVSLGIDTRLIGTGSDLEPTATVFFKPVEGHLVTEIFSRDLQSWVWVDLTSYVLSAYMGKTPLNLNQLVNALFTPLESELQITTFDIKSGVRKTENISKSSASNILTKYFRQGVKIYYY